MIGTLHLSMFRKKSTILDIELKFPIPRLINKYVGFALKEYNQMLQFTLLIKKYILTMMLIKKKKLD